MTHKGLVEPHVLLASSNPMKLIRNLDGILSKIQIKKIKAAVADQSILLFKLGDSHYNFAITQAPVYWRQKTSRLYYAAYNTKRAVSLSSEGQFSTDAKDHERISHFPDSFPNKETYGLRLKNLRDDRNLADYNHSGRESDLIIPVLDAERLVCDFINDARAFLKSLGVIV